MQGTAPYGRDVEWEQLRRFVRGSGDGARLALVTGRRRQGKTLLLRRLVEAEGGIYHQCIEAEPAEQRRTLARTYAKATGLRAAPAFSNWDDALEAIWSMGGTKRRLLVLDEVPYLLARSPDFASRLQMLIDEHAHDGDRMRLVLCGSAVSVMERLQDGDQPLRGRVTSIVRVAPFTPPVAAAFWGIADSATAIVAFTILGGTPGYRTLTEHASPPGTPADIDRFVVEALLDPASPLLDEDVVALREDPRVGEASLYRSLFSAIADGNHRQGQIAAQLGRPQNQLTRPLAALVDSGYVGRTDDALRDARPLYDLAEPMLRFVSRIVRPERSRIDLGEGGAVWHEQRHTFEAKILGPGIEDVARWWLATPEAAAALALNVRPTRVAPATIPDRERGQPLELDAVAVRDRRVLAIAEVKATAALRPLADLERLERARRLIPSGWDATAARLVLVHLNGVTPDLQAAAARRRDVSIVDPATLLGA